MLLCFFFKQKTAYEMRISDWSSDVCSSDLRERAGDYTRMTLAENSGVTEEPLALADLAEARCSRDLCLADHRAGGRTWRIMATRSDNFVDYDELIRACTRADIVVSARRLPKACRPRWLRLDRPTLARTGEIGRAHV